MGRPSVTPSPCPCGSNKPYTDCCGLYIEGKTPAPSAEALMRSRYSAYVLEREAYLLATWHASTRPTQLDLSAEPRNKWLGLQVKRFVCDSDSTAQVEFVARYKISGRAYRLHENSRFVREDGHWFYVNGDIYS